MERWMTIKGIELNSEDALTVTGLKIQGSALTTYYHFLRQYTTPAQRTFFKFILALRQFLIPITSKDNLWNRWYKGTIYQDGRLMGVHEFSNWLNEMKIKLIDKYGKESISDKVKRQNLLNKLPL